jgi:CheY-like chemotaxis protein
MSSGKTGAGGSLQHRRILVVEDEYFLADDMAEALRALDAEILGPVADVQEALDLLATEAGISGAVLDINLHGEEIYPVARELRQRNIPFVFATGYAEGAIPAEYKDVPRWEKPFDVAVLSRALPRFID